MKKYTWKNIFDDILKNKKILIRGNLPEHNSYHFECAYSTYYAYGS